MEVGLLGRPAARCCRLSPAARGSSLLRYPATPADRRHKATANRMKRSLTVQPHPSFLRPSGGSPDKTSGSGGHIIFNPPSSAPSVLHTPFKFLPKNDPRRRANLPSLFDSSTTITYSKTAQPPSASSSAPTTSSPPSDDASSLPPILHPSYAHDGKRHHLSPDDVAEMRRLRTSDPAANSVAALARRFGCSHLFVMMCCQAPSDHAARERERLDRVKGRWGPIRSKAREDRQRRRDMLFRGDL